MLTWKYPESVLVLAMACGTIGQFDKLDWIASRVFTVAVQAPAHVHFLRHGNRHLADLPMAFFTVQTGGDVRAVYKVNEIGQDGDRHPRDWLTALNVTGQFLQLWCLCHNLLVAAPAFIAGWQASRSLPPGTGMAVQARNPKFQMPFVGKLDGLPGHLLCGPDPIRSAAQYQYYKETRGRPKNRFFDDGFRFFG